MLDATYVATSAAPLARKAGLQELVQIGDLGVEVQGNGFATSRAYIASNRDTVKSALKGFVEAIYFIYANKKDAQRVFSKYMRSNDPAVLGPTSSPRVRVLVWRSTPQSDRCRPRESLVMLLVRE